MKVLTKTDTMLVGSSDAYNERFRKMSALLALINICVLSRRVLALKKHRCRHFAKPQGRYGQCGDINGRES